MHREYSWKRLQDRPAQHRPGCPVRYTFQVGLSRVCYPTYGIWITHFLIYFISLVFMNPVGLVF